MTAVPRALVTDRAVALAPRLLGAVVGSSVGGHDVAVRLTEVEAYEGSADAASHAFRGPTARNEVMFGPAGHLYVYFTYGMHWCANLVCGPPGVASAVLLRAGEVIRGEPVARSRRPAARQARDLARGPARLAASLGIDRDLNGVDLCDPDSVLRLETLAGHDSGGSATLVCRGPRVGITTAEDREWRFWLAGEPSVSTFRAGARRRVSAARQTGPS